MADDGIAEQESVLAYLAGLSIVGAGLVFDEVEDSLVLVPDPETGRSPDYIIIVFGEPFALSSDRSMAGVEKQPLLMPIIAECYSERRPRVREMAGLVRTALNGFVPTVDNSSAIEIVGGGSSPRKSSTGKPTRFMRMVSGQTIINLATTQIA